MAYAQYAEACGFESLYLPEHIALSPGAMVGRFELPPSLPYFDPLDCLSFVAAATQRILLGTGVLLLPYRHPVVLAKRLATIDVTPTASSPGSTYVPTTARAPNPPTSSLPSPPSSTDQHRLRADRPRASCRLAMSSREESMSRWSPAVRKVIAERFSGSPRWGRWIKRAGLKAGLAGELG
ncbi:LLM class flavin-dependent oxidoreductase [Nonomuraea basaltis]|uniref:LLM class flavin-dependent oxidoreductase n=1 Tax=Nonomuraea basaltis TaxID=2495887 RepID=UPI001F113FE8|nr:LLM class flavin-dependent oxidoreductase [Nonomuraea basaltis]